MKKLHPCPLLFLCLQVLLVVITGCNPFGSRQSDVSLLPPPPQPPPISPPPYIQPSLEPATIPPFLEEALEAALHTEETTILLRQAEQYFQSGRNALLQGDTDNARARFDNAISILLDSRNDAWDRYRVGEKCQALVEEIYRYDVEDLSQTAQNSGFDTSPLDEVLDITFPVDPNIEMDIKKELKLPVSELPIEINQPVMTYISYFSSVRGKKALIDGLQRQGRYRAMIKRILDEEGVPQELLFMAQVESGFKPRAVSRKRATGLWQFTSLGAREYGLTRTRDYDNRLDPEKATRAAARSMRDLYERLGDWYLALAAYNAGPGRVDLAVRQTGYADFWELYFRKALPRETRNFVPIILATIIMANNPAEYGLEEVVPDEPLEYNSILITASTRLELIADILGLQVSEIKEMNPAILRNIVPAGYTVHVPKGTGNMVLAVLENVPASRRSTWRIHRVGYGDTLSTIADLYETTTESITIANGGGPGTPEAGDLLVIPVSYSFKARSPSPKTRQSTTKSPSTTTSTSASL